MENSERRGLAGTRNGWARGEASIWASGKLVVSPTGESDWKRVELILRGGKR